MRNYATIAGEGFGLVITPFLALAYLSILLLAVPFFLIGLLKRAVVFAFTTGDPLVP